MQSPAQSTPNPSVFRGFSWRREWKVAPITWILAIACVAMFGLQLALAPEGRLVAYPGHLPSLHIWSGALWGLWTPIVLHADWLHLILNVVFLIYFGRLTEVVLRRRGYLAFLVVAAAISSTVEMGLTDQTGVGVSGVVYALFGFSWWMRPAHRLFSIAVTRQMVVLMLMGMLLCVPLTMTGQLNVANGAHFGGLFFGVGVAEVFFRTQQRAWRIAFAALVAAALLPAFWWPVSPRWHYAAGLMAVQGIDFQRADRHFQAAGDYDHALVVESGIQTAFQQLKAAKPDRALRMLEELKPLAENAPRPIQAAYYNGFAWMLATTTEDSFRDGKRALEAARSAAELSDFRDPAILDTLAAAYAEVGDFAKAVQWQETAMRLNGEPRLGPEFQERLALYESRRPYREMP